jgi:hypothetical protein
MDRGKSIAYFLLYGVYNEKNDAFETIVINYIILAIPAILIS